MLRQIQRKMKYIVYCDESRHDGPQSHRYMAIGGLWVPTAVRDEANGALRQLRRSIDLRGEAKWGKVSDSRLQAYRSLVDFFFERPGLQFRVIVVDQLRVDVDRFHEGDQELGFYKFYYEMLEKWIEPGNEYLILLDFKQNSGAHRYGDFRRILRNRASSIAATITDLTVIDSKLAPLGQICDVLTGAVAASCCMDLRRPSAKESLAKYIEARAGLPLCAQTPNPKRCKFNIFRIDLGPGNGVR